jgi:hypothetical protein
LLKAAVKDVVRELVVDRVADNKAAHKLYLYL